MNKDIKIELNNSEIEFLSDVIYEKLLELGHVGIEDFTFDVVVNVTE